MMNMETSIETSEEGSDSGLVAMDGVVAHDGEEPFGELREEVLHLKQVMDKSRWQMSEIFFKINDETIYQRWGYSSFEQYVETEVQMSSRMAQYLVAMYNWYANELGPHMEKDDRDKMIEGVRDIGWTKAQCLIGVTDADNVMEWIERAKDMTSAELKTETRKALVEQDGGDPDEVKDTKQLSAVLSMDQYAKVEEAMSLAEKFAESKKKSHLLSLICQDYIATTMAQEEGGQKNRSKYFDKIGAQFGVKFVAMDKETGKVVHGKRVLKKLAAQ